jgi:hypothetical protein
MTTWILNQDIAAARSHRDLNGVGEDIDASKDLVTRLDVKEDNLISVC